MTRNNTRGRDPEGYLLTDYIAVVTSRPLGVSYYHPLTKTLVCRCLFDSEGFMSLAEPFEAFPVELIWEHAKSALSEWKDIP